LVDFDLHSLELALPEIKQKQSENILPNPKKKKKKKKNSPKHPTPPIQLQQTSLTSLPLTFLAAKTTGAAL
jgi:hypothetical protein